MKVPFFVPPEVEIEPLRMQILQAISNVISAGRYILGKEVEHFEEEFANYAGTRFAVGVSSGTDALVLMLSALDIGQGDEIIVPSFTFAATAEAVLRCGATPVFADVDYHDMCISPQSVKGKVSNRTKAIVAVSLFGAEPNWKELSSFGVPLLLDGAQSFGLGSLHSSWEDAKPWLMASTSFFPSKTIGALGDGGAVFTNDEHIANRIRSLRVHGKQEGEFTLLGGNYRLDAIQAAALRMKLAHLPTHQRLRHEIAKQYKDCLQRFPQIELPAQNEFSYFVIRTKPELREAIETKFKETGIGFGRYYERPLYKEPVFASFTPKPPHKVAEELCHKTLALPFFPTMNKSQVLQVCRAIEDSLAF